MAPSAHRPGVVWTHDDSSGDSVLVAVDSGGRAVASLRPAGARRVDWEALERTDCREGSCIWIADTGDNQERRSDPTLYRLVEPAFRPPDPVESSVTVERPDTVDATAFPVRFPDGPRDVEALFVLPGEDVHLVTKGRNHPVTVYRYPPPLRPDETVTLTEVQTLTDEPAPLPRQVTGAAASPDGRRVAVRTYQTLRFYRVADGLLELLPGGEVNLASLREAQGEGVAWAAEDRIVLTSEAGPAGRRGGMRVLRCERVGAP